MRSKVRCTVDELSCLELVELEKPGRNPGGDVQLILVYKGLESEEWSRVEKEI